MKVSFNITDDGVDPGILHGEVTIDFKIKTKNAMDALRKLQASDIPDTIAAALSEKEPESDKQ